MGDLPTSKLLSQSQNGQGTESHACHEEEGDLRKARQAPCLRRQDHQDQDWALKVRPCEEQDGQDREQEGKPQGQENELLWPLARSTQEGTRRIEDQGLLSDQERNSSLQEGQGAVLQVSAAYTIQLLLGAWGCPRPLSAVASVVLDV